MAHPSGPVRRCRWYAAGPGFEQQCLPAHVSVLHTLADAVATIEAPATP